MKFNFKNLWIPVVTLASGIGSYVIGKCGVTLSCEYYVELHRYSLTLFEPVFIYSMAIAPLTLFTLFAKNTEIRKLLHFAAWWLPLSALLIVLAKINGNSWMPLYPEATKENVAWVMGGLMTVLNIRMILRANRTQKKS